MIVSPSTILLFLMMLSTSAPVPVSCSRMRLMMLVGVVSGGLRRVTVFFQRSNHLLFGSGLMVSRRR